MEDIRTQTKQDSLKAKGRVILRVFNECGQLKERRDIDNLIVTVGKNLLASWLTASQSGAFMPYIGLGSGTNSPTVGDTTLQTELSGGGYSRASGTISSAANVYQNIATFTFSSSFSITEAGLFSASSGGTMFSRTTFTSVPVVNGNVLQVTWQVTFS